MAKQKHSDLSDETMLLHYRRTGDNGWLGHLLQRYTVLLLGVAMKYLKDKEAAQDAVQQVFLKALTHLPAGEIQNFKGWLYVLMRNHCLQLLRDRRLDAGEEALSQISASETDMDALAMQNYTLEQLVNEVEDLVVDQQVCIKMFYFEKNSYQQIMEKTGFSFVQVKSYIQNGKRNLRLALERKLSKK